MARINGIKRPLIGAKVNSQNDPRGANANSERTPLLNSAGMSESLVNKNVSEMQPGVSWGVAAFLLVNTALGAGMLNYPYAYNQIGGILPAALMQIVLLFFITSTMFILVYCADFNHDDTYHDVLLSMCGKRAQQISAISILLTCYGINVTFLVIIGDQYDRIFTSLLPNYLDEWFLDRKFTISMTAILFILPMCYAKRLDFLRHASILGMFSMLYVAFLTVYEHFRLDEDTIVGMTQSTLMAPSPTNDSANPTSTAQPVIETGNLASIAKPFRWFETLAVVPVLCFAYQTHEVIVPVYACMKQRHIGHFMKASIFGLIILFFLYNLVGAYGYMTFGENVGADIMSLYDAKDPIVVVGIVALIVKFITTYPPLMFCGRGALDGLYGEFRKLSTEEFKTHEKSRRIIITTLWFSSTVALAALVPDISLTLQLLGSMAAINVFVFPGMCLVSLVRRLRRARLALLIDESAYNGNTSQQRAKDYYLISGSYFGAMKKDAKLAVEKLSNHPPSSGSRPQQQYAATFASLLEFDNSASSRCGEHSNTNGTNGCGSSRPQKAANGYGSQVRHQMRQEEFERFITNGSMSMSSQDHLSGPIGRPINDSYEDYSDCDDRFNDERSDMISSFTGNNNGHYIVNSTSTKVCRRAIDSDANKDLSIDRSARFGNHNYHNQYHNGPSLQCLQNSLNNRSTTGSILDRLGSSIAPSTVAQIGISKCTAVGLYSFSAMLITFGAFIFVLELVSVFGYV